MVKYTAIILFLILVLAGCGVNKPLSSNSRLSEDVYVPETHSSIANPSPTPSASPSPSPSPSPLGTNTTNTTTTNSTTSNSSTNSNSTTTANASTGSTTVVVVQSPSPSPSPSSIPTPDPITTYLYETQTGVFAAVMDAHTAAMRGNGWAPRQVFVGHNFSIGDQTLFLTSASGNTLNRLAWTTPSVNACNPLQQGMEPVFSGIWYNHGWFLYFKNAMGVVIGNFTYQQDTTYALKSYITGVKIPAGAVSAWLGNFDNVQGGDPSSYDDNEGNRSAASYGYASYSTNGCTFNFKLQITN